MSDAAGAANSYSLPPQWLAAIAVPGTFCPFRLARAGFPPMLACGPGLLKAGLPQTVLLCRFNTHSEELEQRIPSNALIESAAACAFTCSAGNSRRGTSDKMLAFYGQVN